MKRYSGDRTIDGIVVLADGQPLDQRLDLRRFSENGFEWSYEGTAPRQLALALLTDHLGADTARAMRLSKAFMRCQVAQFGNAWELTSDEIDATLREIDPASGTHHREQDCNG